MPIKGFFHEKQSGHLNLGISNMSLKVFFMMCSGRGGAVATYLKHSATFRKCILGYKVCILLTLESAFWDIKFQFGKF